LTTGAQPHHRPVPRQISFDNAAQAAYGLLRRNESDQNERKMIWGIVRGAAWGAILGATISIGAAAEQQAKSGPAELQVDNLTAPLGIDDLAPKFSWQLRDPTRGARQTAYELLVASSEDLLLAGKADVWDSGRIESAQSLNIRYAGPALEPSRRYFWQVKVWGADGSAYPGSAAAWWETGLLNAGNWQAHWIGYETPEEDAVRHAAATWIANSDVPSADEGRELRVAFRHTVALEKPVRSATLYATAQDTVSAWVNGTQVLKADPLPPWKQMPWKKYVRADVRAHLAEGANTVAIEAVHYKIGANRRTAEDAPPMIATLFIEYADGTTVTFGSGTDWKTSTRTPDGWHRKGFDDSQWRNAIAWAPSAARDAAPLGHPWIPDSVKQLRHAFSVSSPVKSARLYSTAFGMYEMFLNGKRVGDDVMAPGWTDYRERVVYQTHDVTAQVQAGANAIAALLAPGWYSTPLEWFQQPNNYGDTPPALRAQLRIEHTDGSVEWVNTDASWKANTSYILHSELYDGEMQDARLKVPGWDSADFSASDWKSAIEIEPKPVPLEAQDYPPIRVERILEAKSVAEPKPGIYIFDFGQNMSAIPRLRVQGPAGTEVRLRFAEILNPDGTLYTENLRTAKATDRFILAGNGEEEFTPQFTFHGFRYAELTGIATKPDASALSALVIHTDAPFAAQFNTGNAMINQLWRNILWGQRSNFVGLPTDCPQRDERLGWMADAQVFWRTAAYNMDIAAFTRKYAADMRGTQAGTPFYGVYAPGTVRSASGSGAGWSDAGVIIPWTSWLQTGDTSVIEQNWSAMEKYLDAIDAANPDGLWKNQAGTAFGDWLSPEGKTDYTLIATAYWAYDLTLMREMAHALGRAGDERKYEQKFQKIRAAFEKEFVRSDGFIPGAEKRVPRPAQNDHAEAEKAGGDTQTGYVLALHMNLLPDHLRAAAADKLAAKIEANHGLLGTGFLGTPYLLEELTKTGHADLAYKLLLNTEYPSWGYLVEQGATTMWERWNGDKMIKDPGMNSYNHYAYGAVADWLYRYAAGIDATPLDAGLHTVILHPTFDARLGSVQFTYPSSYGVISSSWTVHGKAAEWNVTLPANTTGWIAAKDAAHYRLDGVPLAQSKVTVSKALGGASGFELPAGTYTIVVELQP
jgi:alpha-L-rhamnosidase